MSKQISALDIHFLMNELQVLLDSKVNKVYMPEKKKAIIEFFVSGKGKHYLKLYTPEFLCISADKESSEEAHFSALLRKNLNNARLKEISQVGFERIVKLFFEGKEKNYIIYAELFSKGNIVFCKEDNTIIYIAEGRKWKDRTLRGGVKYELPPETINTLNISEDDFVGKIVDKNVEVVKVLAKELSLGGKYATMLCEFAGVDKDSKNLSRNDSEKVFTAWKKLLKKPLSPFVSDAYYPFEANKTDDVAKFETFSQAIDHYYSSHKETPLTRALEKYDQKIDSVKKVLEEQQLKIGQMEKSIEENKNKGELVYNNYAVVKDILDELSKARKTHSWDEIKKKLKSHKIIKEVNEKEGKVVVEF